MGFVSSTDPDTTILWIKESLSGDTPLRAMYLEKKNDIFIKWADALDQKIINGSLELDITGIAHHINKELKSMGLEKVIFYMYEVLPQKYKKTGIQQNAEDLLNAESHYENTMENSSPDFTLQNSTLISISKSIQETAGGLIKYLTEHKVDYTTNDDFAPTIAALADAIKEKSKFVNDGRQKVCKLDQVHLLQILQESTLNAAFDELTAQKMQQSKITSKQVRKFPELSIKDIDPVLSPTTDLQAKQVGFLGVTCEMCSKYRVMRIYNPDANENQDHCNDCDHWQPMQMAITIR